MLYSVQCTLGVVSVVYFMQVAVCTVCSDCWYCWCR